MKFVSFLFWVLAFLAVATATALADTLVAVPVDGEPFEAELTAVDDGWQVTFRSGEVPRLLPAAELVRWGNCPEPERAPVLVLADGSLLAADVFEADEEELTADSDLFGLVKLPLELVAGVVFGLPADRLARDRIFDRVASASGQSDQVMLVNADTVGGRLKGISGQTIRLETDVVPLEIGIHRVRAVVFNPALLRRGGRHGLYAVAGFADGSRLVAERLVVDGKSLEIGLAGGLAWSTASEDLVYLQPRGGRVMYLSDIKPAGYRHVPYLDLSWPYRTDRNLSGGRLRADGRLYLKGLGMHSASRLTYLPGGSYRRFQAELVIDDQAAGRGSVRFRIFVDGKQKYASGTVRGRLAPVPVSVDVTGAKRLDLVVDFADRADEWDHADWLGARLVR